jgi:FKBP-type peptidyl-prolyl cis-trans isomerase FkpA
MHLALRLSLIAVGAGALTAAAAAAQSATPAAGSGPPPISAVIQWVTTPSGLRYADIKQGSGPTPADGQIAVMHFTGWLADGKEFDSSHKRTKPFGFKVGSGQVIKGWDEGVRSMRPGGVRRIVVPPELAYGAKGIPGLIPPNATLTFDIELLKIIDQ